VTRLGADNRLEADFCVEALNEAIAKSASPYIMNAEAEPVCASRCLSVIFKSPDNDRWKGLVA